MSKTTILLVRHGQSEGNILGVFTGQCGYPLTQLGHKQAEMSAEYIRKNYNVEAVYCSDLLHAYETAEHIANVFALQAITDCRYREINAGQWGNKPFANLLDLFPNDFKIWLEDLVHAQCTDGESVLEVAERVTDALYDIAVNNPDRCVVVVTHATPIRTALWKISGAVESAMQDMNWGSNCGISELFLEDGTLQIGSQNITEHLEGFITELPKNL